MSAELPPLPEWSMRDDLGELVPSEVRVALRAYATVALAAQAAEVQALRADAERLQKAWDASFAQAMANGERSISQAAELQSLRDAIANDSLACTYQTLGQYRTMLLAAIDSLLRKD